MEQGVEIGEWISFDEQMVKDRSVAGRGLQRYNPLKPIRQGKLMPRSCSFPFWPCDMFVSLTRAIDHAVYAHICRQCLSRHFNINGCVQCRSVRPCFTASLLLVKQTCNRTRQKRGALYIDPLASTILGFWCINPSPPRLCQVACLTVMSMGVCACILSCHGYFVRRFRAQIVRCGNFLWFLPSELSRWRMDEGPRDADAC